MTKKRVKATEDLSKYKKRTDEDSLPFTMSKWQKSAIAKEREERAAAAEILGGVLSIGCEPVIAENCDEIKKKVFKFVETENKKNNEKPLFSFGDEKSKKEESFAETFLRLTSSDVGKIIFHTKEGEVITNKNINTKKKGQNGKKTLNGCEKPLKFYVNQYLLGEEKTIAIGINNIIKLDVLVAEAIGKYLDIEKIPYILPIINKLGVKKIKIIADLKDDQLEKIKNQLPKLTTREILKAAA